MRNCDEDDNKYETLLEQIKTNNYKNESLKLNYLNTFPLEKLEKLEMIQYSINDEKILKYRGVILATSKESRACKEGRSHRYRVLTAWQLQRFQRIQRRINHFRGGGKRHPDVALAFRAKRSTRNYRHLGPLE